MCMGLTWAGKQTRWREAKMGVNVLRCKSDESGSFFSLKGQRSRSLDLDGRTLKDHIHKLNFGRLRKFGAGIFFCGCILRI